MEKREQLYEGKAKKVYATDDPELVIVDYKDDATAGNGAKKGTIRGKGVVNNKVTNSLMKMLEENGVPTHFVEQLSDRETVVKKVSIVPLEVIVRNVAAGSFTARLGEMCIRDSICTGTRRFFPSAQAQLYTAAAAVGTSVFGAAFFQQGIRLLGGATAAFFSLLEPAGSCVLGALFLSEKIGGRTAAGILLILAAVAAMIWMDFRRAQDDAGAG